MKWSEAKKLVLQEWDDWAPKNVPPGQQARGTDGLIFFGYLQSQRPHLLQDEQGPTADSAWMAGTSGQDHSDWGPLTYAL